MNDKQRSIRTPDQRLRVFVSSTLKELAEERVAVRRAITRLRLHPVMFELGARPYAARDLYRAYLEQSHIFIGIYWQQYGWVAPEMDISGLEDEYRLSGKMPKLVYFKSPAPDIEQGLKAMLRDIQQDNTVSYKRFSTASELQELIENDLALVLTEHFLTHVPSDIHQQITPKAFTHNLPAQATELVGREKEVSAVRELLESENVRLLTLTGPGGTGKTRLALQVAYEMLNQFDDGVYFVPLADINEPDLVVSKIAQHLGVREGGSQPLLESLKSYLQNKSMLLLLDNFEQLVIAATVVSDLLAAAPKLKVFVTSRILLKLGGEYEFPVPPLKVPESDIYQTAEQLDQFEAIRLFSERAKAANPHFEINDENAPTIVEICRRLDGLPLAIELASARVKMLSPRAMLERLNSRLNLLTKGARDLPVRQQTLRNTLDWSYNLLSKGEQTLFTQLSVFVGGFTLEAAEDICGFTPDRGESSEQTLDVFEGITSLMDNSLLELDETDSGLTRFNMLDTIREFARERLVESGYLEILRHRHANHYAAKMNEVGLKFSTSEADYWLDWIEAEHDNLRAALDWSLSDPDVLGLAPWFVSSLNWFWYRRGYLIEGRAWCERILASPIAEGRTFERGLALFNSGAMAMWQGDLNAALSLLEEAVTIGRWSEEPLGIAIALLFHGTALVNQGKDEIALPLLNEAQELFQQLGMHWYRATTMVHMGNAALGMGDLVKAGAYLEEAQSLSQDLGENWIKSFVLNNFGEVARVQGEYDKARIYYEESESVLREMGDKGDLARLVHNLGCVAQHEGDIERAKAQFYESLAMFKKLGNQRGMAECMAALAGLWVERGQTQRAATMLGAAETLLYATGADWWPADRVEVESNLEMIRTGMDENEFALAWNGGKAMTLVAALGYATEGEITI